jgi:hypothetical protein
MAMRLVSRTALKKDSRGILIGIEKHVPARTHRDAPKKNTTADVS